MDKTIVMQGVANKLFAAEGSIDTALIDTTALLGGLLEARQELKLSATVGDDVVAKVAEAVAALTAARSAMVVAHNESNELKLRLGVRAKMFGALEKTAVKSQEDTVVRTIRAA